MRKILIPFDGINYPQAALSFASAMNDKCPVLMVAALLPQTTLATLWAYADTNTTGKDYVPLEDDTVVEAIKDNTNRFEAYCKHNHIEYRIHRDYFDLAIPEIVKESRFADLIILGSQAFFANRGLEPNEYLKGILHDVECPLLLVPEQYEFPVKNAIAYDGSSSSVFALKQFAYLFPEFSTNDTVIFYADEITSFPEEKNIQELAARHFPHLKMARFSNNAEHTVVNWLEENKMSILVSGSFGRSGIYRLFHRSFITRVIQEHKTPIFITHY